MGSIEPPKTNGSLNRFVAAQSWWIASEFVRRNPSMIVQWSDPTGIYDCLRVTDTRFQASGAQILWLNRLGTVQVHQGEQMTVIASWDDVMATDDPHQYVKAIEEVMGLEIPKGTPPATPRTLSYRFMSAVSHLLINERDRWDWAAEVKHGERAGRIALFGEATNDLAVVGAEGWEPNALREAHFWTLVRQDGAAALMVSDLGRVYLRNSGFDLANEYVTRGRSISRLAADFMSDL